ncbi:hypothetical protein GCM10007858_17970 [Bradyrhizobium liaoningense]|nr:hypothetical protein GCM10007858_17970 [Bradyrhizobium liaoningense]
MSAGSAGGIGAEDEGAGPFSIKQAFIMSGQLPHFASHFSVAPTGVYPIQTREARQSDVEIAGG